MQNIGTGRLLSALADGVVTTPNSGVLSLTKGCASCNGAGFVTPDVPIDHPRFGLGLPCPACQELKGPDYPYLPGEDLGICPEHNMKFVRFKNGGIGHNAGTKETPLWCIKGHPPSKDDFIHYLQKRMEDESTWDLENQGEAWCALHRQWEIQGDLIDYPVSLAFRVWYAHQGMCPQYPDPGLTPREQRKATWLAEVERPLPSPLRPAPSPASGQRQGTAAQPLAAPAQALAAPPRPPQTPARHSTQPNPAASLRATPIKPPTVRPPRMTRPTP